MPTRRLTFRDIDEHDELFVWLWTAFMGSGERTNNDEELRRAEKLLDLRDAFSEETVVDGTVFRRMLRGNGPQVMELTVAEYDMLKRSVKAFTWPLAQAVIGRKVREFVDNAEEISDEPSDSE